MNRVIFAGFGNLGYVCLLEAIKQGIQVDLVLTHRDNSVESIDGFCNANKINFSYSDLRKDSKLLNELLSDSYEFLISVNYRYIIPGELLKKVKNPLNLHGSLLPKYRGRTPHVWAIIQGERKTGVTCHIMEETVDTGAIFHQMEIEISNDDTGDSVLKKFKPIYPECLTATLEKIKNGIVPRKQKEEAATYFGKRIPEMGYIDFTKDTKASINFIRAQARPYPGAYCYLPNGQKLIVHKAQEFMKVKESLELGMVKQSDEGYIAKFSNGYLLFSDFELV